jgi:hypothetical protein
MASVLSRLAMSLANYDIVRSLGYEAIPGDHVSVVSRTLKDIKRERLEVLKNKPTWIEPFVQTFCKGLYYGFKGAFVAVVFVGTLIEIKLHLFAFGK